jgi:hypothetical protein
MVTGALLLGLSYGKLRFGRVWGDEVYITVDRLGGLGAHPTPATKPSDPNDPWINMNVSLHDDDEKLPEYRSWCLKPEYVEGIDRWTGTLDDSQTFQMDIDLPNGPGKYMICAAGASALGAADLGLYVVQNKMGGSDYKSGARINNTVEDTLFAKNNEKVHVEVHLLSASSGENTPAHAKIALCVRKWPDKRISTDDPSSRPAKAGSTSGNGKDTLTSTTPANQNHLVDVTNEIKSLRQQIQKTDAAVQKSQKEINDLHMEIVRLRAERDGLSNETLEDRQRWNQINSDIRDALAEQRQCIEVQKFDKITLQSLQEKLIQRSQ